MIIIADAHLGQEDSRIGAFLDMLDALAGTQEDVVFLGDIFLLWMALPGHEHELHTRFLDWCREQKTGRSVGFIEGNHEFFVTQERRDWFTWCAELDWRDDEGRLFVHGDRIGDDYSGAQRLRRIVTGRLFEAALRYVPVAPWISRRVQQRCRHPEDAGNRRDPTDAILAYAETRFREGIQRIFMGHFHTAMTLPVGAGRTLHVLPGWLGTEQITRYDPQSETVTPGHWRTLLGA